MPRISPAHTKYHSPRRRMATGNCPNSVNSSLNVSTCSLAFSSDSQLSCAQNHCFDDAFLSRVHSIYKMSKFAFDNRNNRTDRIVHVENYHNGFLAWSEHFISLLQVLRIFLILDNNENASHRVNIVSEMYNIFKILQKHLPFITLNYQYFWKEVIHYNKDLLILAFRLNYTAYLLIKRNYKPRLLMLLNLKENRSNDLQLLHRKM